MKEFEIRQIQQIADPRTARKPENKPGEGGNAFTETLQNTVARMNELNEQAQTEQSGEGATISDKFSAQKEMFDKIMAEKQNLARLYHELRGSKKG